MSSIPLTQQQFFVDANGANYSRFGPSAPWVRIGPPPSQPTGGQLVSFRVNFLFSKVLSFILAQLPGFHDSFTGIAGVQVSSGVELVRSSTRSSSTSNDEPLKPPPSRLPFVAALMVCFSN